MFAFTLLYRLLSRLGAYRLLAWFIKRTLSLHSMFFVRSKQAVSLKSGQEPFYRINDILSRRTAHNGTKNRIVDLVIPGVSRTIILHKAQTFVIN